MGKPQEQIDYEKLKSELNGDFKQKKEDLQAQYNAWREEVHAESAREIQVLKDVITVQAGQITEAQGAFVKVRDNFMQCHARAIRAVKDGALNDTLMNEIFQITK